MQSSFSPSLVSKHGILVFTNALIPLLTDALCDEHSVFKVETIGDAYMYHSMIFVLTRFTLDRVACGLPVPNEDHPKVMARFALAMSRVARSVRSPVDGSPLRIR